MEDPRESAKARPSRADDQPPTSPTAAAAQLQRLLEYATEHDEYPNMVLRLGLASIRAHAKASKDTGTIDKITNVRHRALDKLATDDVRRVFVLSDLAQDFLAKFEVSKLKRDIEACLHLFHDAASSSTLLPDEHRWHDTHNIGTALVERYRAFGASLDLDLAIEKFKQALALAPEDGPVRIAQLQALGLTYTHKYAESHAQEDFESAKETLQAIIDMGPLSVEHHAQALFDLSSLHLCDFRNSVSARCQEAPTPTSLVENDSTAHGPSHAKRRKDHQLAIVDEMIRLIRASLQKPSTGYSHLERLNQLSVTYLYRYKLTGAEVDRKTSDSIAQNALSMALEGKLDHLKLQIDLAAKHARAYIITEHADHLQATVENAERAIEGSQLTKPLTEPRVDLELGKLYIVKYGRLGCLTDFETGHSLLQRGLGKATSSSSVRRELLIALGGMVHLRRFATDGSSADIEAAIEMFEEALQISSEADSTGVALLLWLGTAYISRYTRTKSPQDLNTV
jgi:tetratricopeptide (TPR) repeat protein